MVFLTAEKKRQTVFKLTSNYFTKEARKKGLYRGKLYPFCLPIYQATQNLFPPIQQEVIKHFSKHNIFWHNSALPDMPSNHLCSSQVYCVNFLYPFAKNPKALKELLLPIYPNIETILEIEKDSYIAFEWIGEHNYLNELQPIKCERKRGIGSTSIDATILYEDKLKKKHLILIEWKYTENYPNLNIRFTSGGTDRLNILKDLIIDFSSIFNNNYIQDINNLLYTAFFQLLRHTLLSRFILNYHEEYEDTSILYLYTDGNKDLVKVQDERLKKIDNNLYSLWKKILNKPDIFQYYSINKLFQDYHNNCNETDPFWFKYISERYNLKLTS